VARRPAQGSGGQVVVGYGRSQLAGMIPMLQAMLEHDSGMRRFWALHGIDCGEVKRREAPFDGVTIEAEYE